MTNRSTKNHAMSPKTAVQFHEIREEKRRLILATALELFALNGYHSTPISRIAKKAGISKGLMYNYFESKEDLLKQLFISVSEEIVLMLDPDNDNEVHDDEALSFIDLFFGSLKNNKQYWQLLIQISLQPDVSESFKNYLTEGIALKSQQLFDNFLVRKNINKPEYSILITSLLKGFVLQYITAPDVYPDSAVESFKNYLKNFILNNSDL